MQSFNGLIEPETNLAARIELILDQPTGETGFTIKERRRVILLECLSGKRG